MVGMGRIVIWAENGAKSLARRLVQPAQKLSLVLLAVPAVEHRYPPPVGENEARHVNRIAKAVFGQPPRLSAANVPTAIGAERFDFGDLRPEILLGRWPNGELCPRGKIRRNRTGHRTKIGRWRAEVHQLDCVNGATPALETSIRQSAEFDRFRRELGQALPRAGFFVALDCLRAFSGHARCDKHSP
jgi:hypothetical protein